MEWLDVRAQSAGAPVEILIKGVIGGSYFDEAAISDAQLASILAGIPKGVPVVVGINSPGGSVRVGLGLFHALKQRGNVTTRNDGQCASIASFVYAAGDVRQASRATFFMLHEPWVDTSGNSKQLAKRSEDLKTISEVMRIGYAAATGKSDAEVAKVLDDETYMTGEEAKSWGLVTEITSYETQEVARMEESRVKNPQRYNALLEASARSKPKIESPNSMNRILSLLAQLNLAAPNASEDQAHAALTEFHARSTRELSEARAEVERLKTENANLRKSEAEQAVAAAVTERRIKDDATLRAGWVAAYVKDPEVTRALIAGMEPKAPLGHPPVPVPKPGDESAKGEGEKKPKTARETWAVNLKLAK